MSVIACLRIPPTPAVCDLCAELTPVVEPAADCVWMDWTGCPPVPVLAERLAKALQATAATATAGVAAVPYRLGVAPRRFAAGVLASSEITKGRTAAWAALPVQAIPAGYWVRAEALPAFAARLPVALLPELEPETRAALTKLDVRFLGDLLSIPQALLQGYLGHEAGMLLDWARGHDPRPVRALYPPERLVHRLTGEALTGADAQRLETAIGQAAAVLAERLQAAGQACARLAVFWGGHRCERHFTPPIVDTGKLARAAWQAVQQVLAGWARQLELPGDCILEVTPTSHWGRQTLLWEPNRPIGGRHHPALAAVRARFGHTFRHPGRPVQRVEGQAAKRADNEAERQSEYLTQGQTGGQFLTASRAREAIARYEAMNRFYQFPYRP